jgi:hypothetical protein
VHLSFSLCIQYSWFHILTLCPVTLHFHRFFGIFYTMSSLNRQFLLSHLDAFYFSYFIALSWASNSVSRSGENSLLCSHYKNACVPIKSVVSQVRWPPATPAVGSKDRRISSLRPSWLHSKTLSQTNKLLLARGFHK